MIPLRQRARQGVLNKSRLRDVLGRGMVDRVRHAGRRAGLRGSLRGYWESDRYRGAILVITMGRVEVAEFVDFDRNGVVDDIFLIRANQGLRRVSR
jgi:hypothetical protein